MGIENIIIYHTSNGVSIDGFYCSGEVVGEWKEEQAVFNLNYALREVRIRVGPVFDEQDRIVGLGRYFYGNGRRMSLREAFLKLEERFK
ncbi:MAG: hypothetical protein ABIJ14_00110 [Nanoarchaeota archaeon]